MPREKPRFFTHYSGKFGDNTAYIVSKNSDGYLVMRSGAKREPMTSWNLSFSLSAVATGTWKEITCKEARALLQGVRSAE